MSGLGDAVLARSPLQSWWRRRNRSRLAILAYHGVDDTDRFARQLDWLRQHMAPIGAQELVAAAAGEITLAPHSVLITFDDGDRSLLERGLPLLRERDLPAIAFVVTELIDTDLPFWWDEAQEHAAGGGTSEHAPGLTGRPLVNALKRLPDSQRRTALDQLRTSSGLERATPRLQLRAAELRELELHGVSIGNHTHSHPCLDRCSPAQIEAEIRTAHERLEAILGHAPIVFAYPNGDHDPAAARALDELGYGAALLFDHRLAQVPAADRFAISRLRVNSYTTLDRFRTIVSGLHPALHRLRGRN